MVVFVDESSLTMVVLKHASCNYTPVYGGCSSLTKVSLTVKPNSGVVMVPHAICNYIAFINGSSLTMVGEIIN